MDTKKITLQIKGTPLVKFQSEKRIDSFQKGKVYANTLSYYRKLEETTGDSRVGDQFEAMLHIHEGYFENKETGEITELRDTLVPTFHSNDYAFCMFSCYHTPGSFSFSDQQKAELLSMGDTALIILDNDEFRRRVQVAAEAQGFEVHFGPVNYFDESEDNANMIISTLRGMWNLAFWKRKDYSYQQEARFVFSPYKEGVEHIELDIGDISDISQKVDARSALTAFVQEVKKEDR